MPQVGRTVLARIAPQRRAVVALAQPLQPVRLRPAVVHAEDADQARRSEARRVLVTRCFALAGMSLVAWRLFFTLPR